MLPVTPKKKPVKKNVPLKSKVKQVDPLQTQIIAEQRKEIARLRKLVAKIEVKKDSQISGLKAKLAEEKKNKIRVVVQNFDKTV